MIGSIVIIFIGLAGTILQKKVINKLIALDIMNSGVVCFFVKIGKTSQNPPIFSQTIKSYANPLPQAAIVTSIVIGFATLALSIAIISVLEEKTGKSDEDSLEKIKK